MTLRLRHVPLLTALLAALAGTGCAPLIVGGAMVGSAVVATDRRTTGTQLEDQGIELKAATRIKEQLGERAHATVNSYNRVVLVTGEANSEESKALIERIVAGVENVQRVMNEVAVMPASSLSSRSNDLLISSKVKTKLIEARDLFSNAYDVVVERGTVFLMGRVTEREASRATDIVRDISGVNKVVRAFEIISEEELARVQPKPKAEAEAPKQ